jgi:hypothetical protein
MSGTGVFARLRSAGLRQRTRALVHEDRVMSDIDAAADQANALVQRYRDVFPNAFGPCVGRRAGDRSQGQGTP